MQHESTPQDSKPHSEHMSAKDLKLTELIKRGATMEEIAQLKEPVAKTPAEALRALKAGNARFFSGQTQRPDLSPMERRAQIIGQTPFAVILGCADSRVPTEMVFDQGSGHLFTNRVAGNVIGPSTLGSIEYAILHLKTHLVAVMGHEGCGAVSAAMTMNEEQRRSEPEFIQLMVGRIAPAVSNLPAIRDNKARMREAVISNVRLQVHILKENPVVEAAIKRKQIAVVGAYYEISSGAVDFLETEEDLRL
jgi:carbonic anhydrase